MGDPASINCKATSCDAPANMKKDMPCALSGSSPTLTAVTPQIIAKGNEPSCTGAVDRIPAMTWSRGEFIVGVPVWHGNLLGYAQKGGSYGAAQQREHARTALLGEHAYEGSA